MFKLLLYLVILLHAQVTIKRIKKYQNGPKCYFLSENLPLYCSFILLNKKEIFSKMFRLLLYFVMQLQAQISIRSIKKYQNELNFFLLSENLPHYCSFILLNKKGDV